ncbi:Maltose O-acetyltransferase [compost metagenome]
MLYNVIKIIKYIIRNISNKIYTLACKNSFKNVGSDLRVFRGFYCTNPKNIIVGNEVLIDQDCWFISEFLDSSLKIGNKTKINSNVYLDYSGDLIIGDNTTISSNTKIYTHSHGYDPNSKPIKKKLIIGNNVWIGSNVLILENVDYISDNSLIAAGSVLTKNVERNQIFGGNPSRLITSK